MTSLQEGTQAPVTHTIWTHPMQTFNNSHLLNIFVEKPILMYEKVLDARHIARYLKRSPAQTWHTAIMHDIHQFVTRTQTSLCLGMYNQSVATTH